MEHTLSLSTIVARPKPRKPLITIFGDAGMGKTTLAATFPKPLFILAEDGLMSVTNQDVAALPLIQSSCDLWSQLKMVVKEDHEYQTLVIDSVSALDRIFIEEMIAEDLAERKRKDKDAKPAPINQILGGYGAGYAALASRHERVRRAAVKLSTDKNMTVVFLGHADIEQIDLPDQDPFMRYSLRLSKKSMPSYVDGVDLVGFLHLQAFVDKKKGKANSFGSRQLVCHASANNVSKNRFGIEEPITIEVNQNPLLDLLNLRPVTAALETTTTETTSDGAQDV